MLGSPVFGQLRSEGTVERHDANQLDDITHVLGLIDVVQAAAEFDGDEILEADDADAVDDGNSLYLMCGVVRSDCMNADMLHQMFTTSHIPHGTSSPDLAIRQGAIGSVQIEIGRRPEVAVETHGNTA
jgi:hypothetical protein